MRQPRDDLGRDAGDARRRSRRSRRRSRRITASSPPASGAMRSIAPSTSTGPSPSARRRSIVARIARARRRPGDLAGRRQHGAREHRGARARSRRRGRASPARDCAAPGRRAARRASRPPDARAASARRRARRTAHRHARSTSPRSRRRAARATARSALNVVVLPAFFAVPTTTTLRRAAARARTAPQTPTWKNLSPANATPVRTSTTPATARRALRRRCRAACPAPARASSTKPTPRR